MRILFLYTELAQYFMTCLETLSEKNIHDIHVVRMEVNPEAPFNFQLPQGIHFYDRTSLQNKQLSDLADKINPEIIYCSGWKDKAYLKVCKKYKSKIPVILGFDNQWTGSVRQRLASWLSPIMIKRYFSHCWIPGEPQYQFAKAIGFDDNHILKGVYSCDYDYFNSLHKKYIHSKEKSFPHRFIYVGRYYDFKGVQELWKAFFELKSKGDSDWELWCLGTGSIPPVQHDSIKHFGFIQPDEMEQFIAETGVFIMPSQFEPWGVALHEFAAAGFPLIASDAVGSASLFLKQGLNGFIFKAGDKEDLKKTMNKIIMMSDKELLEYGERSSVYASFLTPDKWADTLLRIQR